VDSPISTPDEFVYDNPHVFGTKRTGPDLSRVGLKHSEASLVEWLRDPQAQKPSAHMPKLELEASEAEALAAFLASLKQRS
jgi:cytochrome c oxidase cbb3-type subunit 2